MEISAWAKSVTDTIKHDMPTESELADVVADLQTAERTLAECRRMLLSELTGPVAGRRFRIVESRQAKRSYNTSGLLAAFGGTGAIPSLVHDDIVRLDWQWSKLRDAAYRNDITLHIAQHEIDDGDTEALVGETWQTRWTVEANDRS